MNGERKGVGMYFESSSGLTYSGEWFEDMRHGNGNLSSKN